MHTILRIAVIAASLFANSAWAYGGGGGSSGCEEPKFLEPNPIGPVTALAEFGFVASDNTEIDSLTVEINGQKIQPAVVKRRNGDFEVKAALPQAITEAGKARIAVAARSRDGCAGFQAYYVEIKP